MYENLENQNQKNFQLHSCVDWQQISMGNIDDVFQIN